MKSCLSYPLGTIYPVFYTEVDRRYPSAWKRTFFKNNFALNTNKFKSTLSITIVDQHVTQKNKFFNICKRYSSCYNYIKGA